ncbi:DNA internalization-related competence protein ComEC/Rec2 [Microbulbifer variabilis]|uniref:DNA internalization-related competence protein ComEC/Rec2 n=1 Tax=Microbulbifer variabilis TaxID=266805 RepID=UPI001CFD946E|nr:DNA internalization-related competence protein ComEC/Rec2 [Microbulbifer variabilis]
MRAKEFVQKIHDLGVERWHKSTLWLWSLTLALWVFSLSIAVIGVLPVLPEIGGVLWVYLIAFLLLLALPQRRSLSLLLVFSLLGALWALISNKAALEQRLAESAHGMDQRLKVEVVSLPEVRNYHALPGVSTKDVRFQARVLEAGAGGIDSGSLLYLTWYRADREVQARLRGNSHWVLTVRLKRPRGSVNPHTFDYEGWLLRRGVYATGYVRTQNGDPQWLEQGGGLSALRDTLREKIQKLPINQSALVTALLLGDRSDLSYADKDLLRQTGTAHLLAISGLHVGMVAGFLLLLGQILARALGVLLGASPRWLPVLLALLGTLAYTLLAGAPLSAQRALVMTWVLLLAWHWRRRVGAGMAFSLALALVLFIQPLAFFGVGFWLSFTAVGALLLGFSGRRSAWKARVAPIGVKGVGAGVDVGVKERIGASLLRGSSTVVQLLRSQWLVALGLILPSIVYFSGYSSGGMLLNLLAIPWLGLVILPALMLGTLLMGTVPGIWCLKFADWQLALLMGMLEHARDLVPTWQPLLPPQSATLLILSALGALLLILPRGVPGRYLGLLFLLPILQPLLPVSAPGRQGLTFTALDVGQGLALSIRTQEASLVFDTGPVSSSGWSAGGAIVAPFLSGVGVRALDALVVSHGDRDHAGGVDALLQSLSVSNFYAPGQLGEKLAGDFDIRTNFCVAGESLFFGDLTLQWLWPLQKAVNGEENDQSCVALIEWQHIRILLTGDITSSVESRLVELYPMQKPVDLLVAPHHGSRTSSSQALLSWARPGRVIFSAGYRHHFGHPHADVVTRYRAMDVEIFNTAQSGAIEFYWRSGASEPVINQGRSTPRFWYADHNGEAEPGGRLSRRE